VTASSSSSSSGLLGEKVESGVFVIRTVPLEPPISGAASSSPGDASFTSGNASFTSGGASCLPAAGEVATDLLKDLQSAPFSWLIVSRLQCPIIALPGEKECIGWLNESIDQISIKTPNTKCRLLLKFSSKGTGGR
jgi:hypothetical protein